MPYREQIDDDVLAGKDHELTLSTAAIFGIFFGLVLLCAVFFGFGYTLGSHKSPLTPAAEASDAPAANFSAFKPAAGQPLGSAPSTPHPTPVVSTTPAETKPDPAPPVAEPAPAPAVRVASAVPSSDTPPTRPAPSHPAPAAAPAVAPGNLVVQVAAISIAHPDDATLMANALRARGYTCFTHSGPDNFIHVLVGPFNNRPAAEATVKHLSTDGYTAYIK